MASTLETMTPEEILRGIIDGSLVEFEDENVTKLQTYRFRSHNALKVINLPNVTQTYGQVFSNMQDIEHAYLKKLANLTSSSSQTNDTGGLFRPGGTAMKELVLQSYVSGINIIMNRKGLVALDLGQAANGVSNQSFDGCSDFKTLIVRRTDKPMPLSHAPNSWVFRGTKFISGGVLSMYLQPLSRLTKRLRTGLRSMAMAISSCLSRDRNSSITTQTVPPSNSRTGVMVYG